MRLWTARERTITPSDAAGSKISQDREPKWTIWKHIPEVKPYEAVALSLDIDPNKVRRPPLSWATGKHMSDEDQVFKDRLFVLERNLEVIGVRTFVNVPGWDEYPLIRLQAFAVWAKSVGWCLPAELEEIAAVERADPHPPELCHNAGAKQSELITENLPPETAALRSAPAKRRGPTPGSVRRYDASDRRLFPEIERLMQHDRLSSTAAALKLARGEVEGKTVEGGGIPESKAKRLAKLFRTERGTG